MQSWKGTADVDQILENARTVFLTQAEAISNLSNLLTDDFEGSVRAILDHRGRVVVCGIGKSGIIGKKIAATLSSTGTPSFFIHPTEAFHGDLGMITKDDILLGISKSGETEEMIKLIPFFKENGIALISMTGNPNSTMARHSDFHLNINVSKEACPLQLAPTTSTTAALVMGDALAVALMKERNFQVEHFARFHPGGSLGRKLLLKAKDLMITRKLPVVNQHSDAREIVNTTVKGSLGLSIVTDRDCSVLGVITAGDIMRAMERSEQHFFSLKASDMMTMNPKAVGKECRIIDAEELMKRHEITVLLVIEDDKFIGILHLKDI